MKKIESKFNGTLEVGMYKGRKVLDSENANYSFGAAQGVWNETLAQIDLAQVKSVLLFGLGAGSVLDIMRHEFKFKNHITCVEIDPVVIDIAKKEFGVKPSKNLAIECMDAYDYVLSTKEKFDLIIVDISIDYTIPEKILTEKFWKAIVKLGHENGMIAFNALNYGRKITHIREILKGAGYKYKVKHKVNGTNSVVFASFS